MSAPEVFVPFFLCQVIIVMMGFQQPNAPWIRRTAQDLDVTGFPGQAEEVEDRFQLRWGVYLNRETSQGQPGRREIDLEWTQIHW